MNATTAPSLPTPASRSKRILIWVLRILVAGVFLAGAVMKLTGQPMMIAEFQQIGLGEWFRLFTGALELAFGVAVLVPAFSAVGAAVLLAVDVGAFVAQIEVLHKDWIHTIVIGVLLALLIYGQRTRILGRRSA